MSSEDELLTLAKAAREFPGKPPHLSTVWRWVLHGVGGVKLNTHRVGGRRFTTRRDIQYFLKQLNSPKSQSITTAAAAHEQRIAAAERELEQVSELPRPSEK